MKRYIIHPHQVFGFGSQREQKHHQSTKMGKPTDQSRGLAFFRERSPCFFLAIVSFLMVCALWSFYDPSAASTFFKSSSVHEIKAEASSESKGCSDDLPGVNHRRDPPEKTFYDDPELSYSVETPVTNWDQKRREWLKLHPWFASGNRCRVVIVSGSQPSPCQNPVGDHLLLRLFKNKVDYGRIHGYDVFYNTAFLHPKVRSVWAKLPAVRAAMVAHPEAEWIWWVDSDAVFTDMEFKLPFKKYANYNFIVPGWSSMLYEQKSWVSLNSGVFLIRNCQWSMDFITAWAGMGPQSPDHEKWDKTVRSIVTVEFPGLNEQSSLVYMMLVGKNKWGKKVYIEEDYDMSGYWLDIVDRLDNFTKNYVGIEREVPRLRRRHAVAVTEGYGGLRDAYLKEAGYGKEGWRRRPFVTHFTGCQPCSGHHNPSYTAETCWNQMARALNFADNQVLRSYGFMHDPLLESALVSPLPFDSPA